MWHQNANGHMLKKLTITSRTAETHEPVASHSDHHWLQAPATGLWWWSIPPRYTQPLYSRFEMQMTHLHKNCPPPNDQALCLSAADVRKTLSRINPKGCGSWQHTWPCTERLCCTADGCPNRYLQHLAEPVSRPHMSQIHNDHTGTKEITCVLPKRRPPIALTPIIMKCFERLVMQKIKTSLLNTLDPLQFAYRPNRSTDDAISTTLHLALTHLENKDSYVRMLFIDFSSAFNTIIPQQLINKLNLLGLNNSLCNWILDFLTGRPQSVRVGHNTSSTTTLNTGAPQGCVLSPLLFTLLTHDCTAKFSSNHIIKFADIAYMSVI